MLINKLISRIITPSLQLTPTFLFAGEKKAAPPKGEKAKPAGKDPKAKGGKPKADGKTPPASTEAQGK